MDNQIVKVVAGESHTLALAGNGKVFAWGKGLFGRLGNGSPIDQPVPAAIELPSSQSAHRPQTDGNEPPHHTVVSIAAGAYHSLALTDDGMVWSWGYNNSGS